MLLGRVVTPHPENLTDPEHRPGEIGNVSSKGMGSATVKFDDGFEAEYSLGALVTLAPRKSMLNAIVYHHERLGARDDLKPMLLVYKLLTENRRGEALKLSRSHSTASLYCTWNCRALLEMKNKQKKFLKRKRKLCKGKSFIRWEQRAYIEKSKRL